MKCRFYLQNGVLTEALPDGYDKFYVMEDVVPVSETSRFYYRGDEIQYELDALCVELYDVFRDKVFTSADEYYGDYGLQPQWICRAGLDSAFDMPKDQLAECFSKPIQDRMAEIGVIDDNLLQLYKKIDTKKYKYAYVADCQSLVNTLQELILSCHSSFIGFYKNLCSLCDKPQMNDIYFESSAASRMVYSFLHSFFIQAYSTFDILTKFAYELQNIRTNQNSYIKLASTKILYGNKKDLTLDKTGTIFEKCRTTSMIENLRNELVHNATWEMNPKIFIIVEDGKIKERHIFMPDFTLEGTLITYKNRKRFFSDGKKVNDELPGMYFDVLHRIRTTLQRLIESQ